MEKKIYNHLIKKCQKGYKSLAVLLDPDKTDLTRLKYLLNICMENKVDYLMVGGSLIMHFSIEQIVQIIKGHCNIPVILFPGNSFHLDFSVDAILFLSLISGRNPDYLIGQQMLAAPLIKKHGIESISTGYMLVNSGAPTTASYVSHTIPIPNHKPEIAAATAMAGEMLGMKQIYLDAGSGAEKPVSTGIIEAVRKSVNCPLLVGGGLNCSEKALQAVQAGADLLVIGNGVEKNPELIIEVSEKLGELNQSLDIY
ncbi:MAG: geranylgeranylglyceryl/heptaprenylglyceryl phosphate synthase [Candidatus Cyclobacteriaceae bacterium M3_2C_046]